MHARMFGDDDPDPGFGPMLGARMGGPKAYVNQPVQKYVTEPFFFGPVPLILGPSSWGFGIGFGQVPVFFA